MGIAASGLATPHVFYFGNAVGEGNSTAGTNTVVGIADEIAARNNPKRLANFASVNDLYDYHRNRQVNVADQFTARNNATTISTHLTLSNIVGSGGGHGDTGRGVVGGEAGGDGGALQPAAFPAAGCGASVSSDDGANQSLVVPFTLSTEGPSTNARRRLSASAPLKPAAIDRVLSTVRVEFRDVFTDLRDHVARHPQKNSWEFVFAKW